MTCQYTTTRWRDALYNSIREANGGVEAAAMFLTQRRNVSIHPESLRRKLRGGDQLDIDVAVLLTEFLSNDVGTSPCAKDWLLSLCAQEGLHVDDVPPAPVGGWACEVQALQAKFMGIAEKVGKIATVTAQTTSDGVIDQDEADQLVPLFREARVLLHRMERNVLRAVQKGGAAR